jgi:HD-like signal output (HDOD) protein
MNPAAEKMIAQAINLPQVPVVMQEVVKSLRNDKVPISQLAELVRNDPVIAAKVLRLANSSYYGARREVSSINEALKVIGLASFRNRVIASSLVTTFTRLGGVDLADFWRNSMLVANLADLVGRNLPSGQESHFSAGLLHGIGQLLIFLCVPEFAPAVARCCNETRLEEQRGVEQALLQTDHFEMGIALAQRWDFPESIQSAIGHHDTPADDDLAAQVVHAAVKIAHALRAGQPPAAMLAELAPAMAERLQLSPAWFEAKAAAIGLLQQESAALI